MSKNDNPLSAGKNAVVRLSEGAIESGWLLAVVLAPLFFNIFSSQVFEPDKATVLRLIAVVMSLAWVVKVASSRATLREEARKLKGLPLLIPIVLIVVSYLLSSTFSLDPWVSWSGSYERRHGVAGLLSCLVIFFLLATHLRYRRQLERLLFAQALTSVAVSAYAIAQFFNVDPLPWGEYFRTQAGLRVTSTLGNPIFLGAFLLLPFFVTMGWIVSSWIEARAGNSGHRSGRNRGLSVALTVILGIQLFAMFLTSSRGPVAGLLCGFWFLSLGGLFIARQRFLGLGKLRLARATDWGAAGLLLISLAAAIGLVALNTAVRPDSTLEQNRLERLLRLDSPTTRVRTILWNTVPEIVAAKRPLEFPDGRSDDYHFTRPWFGYGPDNFAQAFARYYPAELGKLEKRRARPDRAHNDPLHVLVTRGWLGFLTYAFLILTILRKSGRWLGVTSNRGEDRNLSVALLAVALGTTAGFWLLAPAYLGFGLLGGLLGAFLVFWYLTATPQEGPGLLRSLMVLALLSALVSHWAETLTGFPIIPTSLYFWTTCATLVLVGERLVRAENSRAHWQRREGVPEALVTCLVLVTLCFDFVGNWDRSDSGLAEVLGWITGTPASGWLATLPNLFLILLLTWVFGATLVFFSAGRFRGLIQFTLFSLGPAYLFLSVQALYPTVVRIFPNGPRLGEQLALQHLQVKLLLIAVAVIWLLEALVLCWPGTGRHLGWRGLGRAVMVAVVAVGLAGWASHRSLQTLEADVLLKQAESSIAVGQPELGDKYLKQLIELRPSESHYHTARGKIELERARQIREPDQRDALFDSSRRSLEAARRIDPLDITVIENLAVLYRTMAQGSKSRSERRTLLDKARDQITQALGLSPNLAYLYNELAAIWLALGDYEEAEKAFKRSLELDDTFPATYQAFGVLRRLQAELLFQSGNVEGAREEYIEAVGLYESVLAFEPESVEAHSALAFLKWQLGLKALSIDHHLQVLRLQPSNFRSHRRLGEIYYSMGRYDESSRYVIRGLQLSPQDSSLLELNRKLESGRGKPMTGSEVVP